MSGPCNVRPASGMCREREYIRADRKILEFPMQLKRGEDGQLGEEYQSGVAGH